MKLSKLKVTTQITTADKRR